MAVPAKLRPPHRPVAFLAVRLPAGGVLRSCPVVERHRCNYTGRIARNAIKETNRHV